MGSGAAKSKQCRPHDTSKTCHPHVVRNSLATADHCVSPKLLDFQVPKIKVSHDAHRACSRETCTQLPRLSLTKCHSVPTCTLLSRSVKPTKRWFGNALHVQDHVHSSRLDTVVPTHLRMFQCAHCARNKLGLCNLKYSLGKLCC